MIEGQEDVSWPDWRALAQGCERHGIGTLFRSDHYLVGVGLPRARLARRLGARSPRSRAVTTTLRFGTMVSPATFRHPSVLAKSVVTADHVSGGRVELGHRHRLARGRAPRVRLPIPAARRARRAAGRAAARSSAAVGGGAVRLRRRALPRCDGARRAAQAGAAAAPAADPRRPRRPPQPRARRPLGRRVQHGLQDARRAGGDPARARRGLRRGGTRADAAVADDRLAGGRGPRRAGRARRPSWPRGRARRATARRSSRRVPRAGSSAPPRRREASSRGWPTSASSACYASTCCTATSARSP